MRLRPRLLFGPARIRQGCRELEQGRFEFLPHPQLGQRGRDAHHEQSPCFIRGQAGQRCAVFLDQGHPASGPAFGIHGHTRGGEGCQIAVDGPLGHFQLACQFSGGHPSACLQQHQQGEQSVSAHQ